MTIKCVLNTSVVLAGLLSNTGASYKVLELLFKNKIENYTSKEILKEYFETLIRKSIEYYPLDLVLEFYTLLEQNSKLINPKNNFLFCRDPDDNKFLDVVYESKSKYLITLDKDLLDLRDENKEFKIKDHKFKILKPIEFLELIEY